LTALLGRAPLFAEQFASEMKDSDAVSQHETLT
jgi:hypothetical protein